MEGYELKDLSKADILGFIRERLSWNDVVGGLKYIDSETFKKEHRRFEMSGYESKPGECTVSNNNILNLFADLGIYDYTSYLFLDFYKGAPTLYLKYFQEDHNLEFEFTGDGTVDIIYKVFEKTILSGKRERRRS